MASHDLVETFLRDHNYGSAADHLRMYQQLCAIIDAVKSETHLLVLETYGSEIFSALPSSEAGVKRLREALVRIARYKRLNDATQVVSALQKIARSALSEEPVEGQGEE